MEFKIRGSIPLPVMDVGSAVLSFLVTSTGAGRDEEAGRCLFLGEPLLLPFLQFRP